MTKTLAEEDARKGITVNVIAPDCIDTPMMHRIPVDFLQDLLNDHPMQRCQSYLILPCIECNFEFVLEYKMLI